MTDGGYAEVAYARASGLVAIPEELTDLDAAPLLCAGFTTFNALVKAGAKAGDLAVQGIGKLGPLSVHYAAKMGMEVVAIARGTTKGGARSRTRCGLPHRSVATDATAELRALSGAQVVLATAAAGDTTSALLDGFGEWRQPDRGWGVRCSDHCGPGATDLRWRPHCRLEDSLRFAVHSSNRQLISYPPPTGPDDSTQGRRRTGSCALP